MHLECKDMSNNWKIVNSCVIEAGQPQDCGIDEGDFMTETKHMGGHQVICRSVVMYTSNEGAVSHESSFTLQSH
jgi:hypothetical protein